MLIPEPPRRPLDQPGATLEGTIVWTEAGTSAFGRPELRFRIQDGPVVTEAIAPVRLWQQMWTVMAGDPNVRLRITRLEDSPAVGNGKPARNWTVERVAHPSQQVPQPPPAQPQRVTTQQVPAW
jgi:hypothetical protein